MRCRCVRWSGPIPGSISALGRLENLQLSENLLTSLHGALGALSRLTYLQICCSTTLTGSIPSTLSALSLLRTLDLGGNTLTGTIPSDIFAGMSLLSELYLHYNSLNGALPPSLGALLRMRCVPPSILNCSMNCSRVFRSSV